MKLATLTTVAVLLSAPVYAQSEESVNTIEALQPSLIEEKLQIDLQSILDEKALRGDSRYVRTHTPVKQTIFSNVRKGGFLGFARECAELEVLPFMDLEERDDLLVLVGVNFDGVLGIHIFMD